MKIQFLGTSASEGVPSEFCQCEYCQHIRELGKSEFRTRAQVLIDDIISIDYPPDAYVHSFDFSAGFSKIKYILATHSHFDHFYAHDFVLRGYKYAKKIENCLHIYGNSEVCAVFNECTLREMKPQVADNVRINAITPYEIFEIDCYRVITLPANHSKTESALLFYIEKNGKGYLHFYDTARVSDAVFDFLRKNNAKIDVVCFDCTFIEYTAGEEARHMGIEDDMAMKDKLLAYNLLKSNCQIIVSHFSHNSNPTRAHLTEIEKRYGVTAAYDGYTVEI